MMVVDSSVWIAWFRRIETAQVLLMRSRFGEALIGDLVLLEVLQGARNDAHAARLGRTLRNFPVVAMVDDEVATLAAAHYRLLRGRGITIRKTVDLLIGTFCVTRGHELLHDDRDFTPMVTHLGLRIADRPH